MPNTRPRMLFLWLPPGASNGMEGLKAGRLRLAASADQRTAAATAIGWMTEPTAKTLDLGVGEH
jgi:hypothetical protein